MNDEQQQHGKESPDAEGGTGHGEDHRRCVTVGVGASAGGTEALEKFFAHMPTDSGMAFVVVLHGQQEHEAITPEILEQFTRIPVEQVTDQAEIEPNHIYLISPELSVTCTECTLRVSPPASRETHAPIDNLFSALAQAQGDHIVCVILSGSGTDGVFGIRTVKEHGGLVIAQSVESAKFGTMPYSAILTGQVDYILPVERIPPIVVEYVRHLGMMAAGRGLGGIREEAADYLGEIFTLLRRKTSHDFSRYKQSTVIRRIQRRMQVLQLDSVHDYVDRLRKDPKEVELLFRDLLIGVTHFFRDTEAFEMLAGTVIPKLFEDKSASDHVRIWIVGCATGEEAYSVAMLLCEHMSAMKNAPHVQIFATDIDDRALEIARQARYPEGISEHVSQERLERFFTHQGNRYQVAKEIRDMCIFSTHNLINDPPFSRLDMICCRNLLIYLEGSLQKRIVPLFHHALRPGGYLFLGPSESVASHPQLFRAIDKKHRIYRRKSTIARPPINLPFNEPRRFRHPDPSLAAQLTMAREQQVTKALERILLENYAPASVVINEQHDIIYFSGRTGKYLEPPTGAPSLNIVNMARKGLRMDLRAALHRAVTTRGQVIQENVSVETNGMVQMINIIVRPMSEVAEEAGLLLVIFQEVGVPTTSEQAAANGSLLDTDNPVIQQLEQELRATKEYLQTAVEELETSNEELKSSNEELLSMNEELQSANEELQTSKEELQSLNEELYTVNAELKEKVEELHRLNSDLQNLFQSTQIATIFLDRELHIKKFTPTTTEVFRLIESDIGRPITDIAPRFSEVDPIPIIQTVLRTYTTVEREVKLSDRDAWFIMRILPYRTLTNAVDGVVITFVDVTDLKQTQEQLFRLAAIVESSGDAIIGKTLDGRITSWNMGAHRLYGYTAEEVINRPISLLAPPERVDEIPRMLERISQGERVEAFETIRVRKDGSLRNVLLTISPVFDSNGGLLGASTIARDVTDRKHAEQELRRSQAELTDFIEHANVSLNRISPEGTILWANQAELEMLGYAREEYVGHSITEFYEEPEMAAEILGHLSRGESLAGFEAKLRHRDGSPRYVVINASAYRESDQLLYSRCFARDITERVLAELALRRSEERLRFVSEALPHLIWLADADGILRECNQRWSELTGLSTEDLVRDGTLARVVHPDDMLHVRSLFARHKADGEEFLFEFRIRRGSDDAYVWYQGRCGPLKNSRGEILNWLGTAFDIDERKLNEESLRRYREHFDLAQKAAKVGTFELHIPTGAIVWSQDLESLYGLERGAFAGTLDHWLELIHPEDRASIARGIQNAIDAGEFIADFRIRPSAGTIRWLMIRAKIFYRDDVPERMVGVHVDVTERHSAEEALQRSSQRMELVINSTKLGLWYCDLPFNVLDWNDRCREHFGIPPGTEITIEMFFAHLHPEDRERTREAIEDAIAHHTVYDIDYRTVAPDGEMRWIRAIGRCFYDDDERPVSFDGISIDMTEIKQVEEEIRQAKLAAETANAAKDQFLAVLSHELRTPLTPVLASVELLKEEHLPDEIQPLVDVIQRNIELEARLIDDLLDLTRIIKGKLRLSPEVLDVHAMVQNVIDICRADIGTKQLILVVDLHAEQHFIEADPARIQQVFWNLLKNAIKFTPDGGTIEIRSRNLGTEILIEIADTGIGIEDELLDIIFNAFEQGEQTMTRRYGGLGLGLTISKSIVEMHEGAIAVQSEGRDRGATFSVRLPLTVMTDRSHDPEILGIAPAVSTEGLRILLVDDHNDTVSVMRLLLKRRGFQVYTAYSLESASKIASEQEFDLVISDIGLPDGSGLDLFHRLRERGPVKAIAVSGFGTQEDTDRSISAGFAIHLVKPFTARALHEAINSLFD